MRRRVRSRSMFVRMQSSPSMDTVAPARWISVMRMDCPFVFPAVSRPSIILPSIHSKVPDRLPPSYLIETPVSSDLSHSPHIIVDFPVVFSLLYLFFTSSSPHPPTLLDAGLTVPSACIL
ncbi:hypothetical protein BDV59DRAFT_140676 [Aspergillus ambiguus]|uniref:uncharacterized protein n=1 Tax=Aspergillus ambiguus TaxID=176160 RepID=UPI003CCCD73B